MWFLFLLIVSGLSANCAALRSHKRPLHLQNRPIVGGVNADISSFPHQVSLATYSTDEEGNRTTSHFCGGSIISVDWVLTAAHCLTRSNARDIVVRVGSSVVDQGGYLHDTDYFIYHPTFDYHRGDCDIAVLKVAQPFEIGPNVKPVTLNRSPVLDGSIAIVSGWGVTDERGSTVPTILQKVEIPVLPHWECKLLYGERVTENMICAGRAGRSACYGDSGGPISVGGVQIGIVSWGKSCYLPNHPAIYTNVEKLRHWIRKHTAV